MVGALGRRIDLEHAVDLLQLACVRVSGGVSDEADVRIADRAGRNVPAHPLRHGGPFLDGGTVFHIVPGKDTVHDLEDAAHISNGVLVLVSGFPLRTGREGHDGCAGVGIAVDFVNDGNDVLQIGFFCRPDIIEGLVRNLDLSEDVDRNGGLVVIPERGEISRRGEKAVGRHVVVGDGRLSGCREVDAGGFGVFQVVVDINLIQGDRALAICGRR